MNINPRIKDNGDGSWSRKTTRPKLEQRIKPWPQPNMNNLNKILEAYRVFTLVVNAGINDKYLKRKPQLNALEAKQQIVDEFIRLIGRDEKPSPTALRGDIWSSARNSLRAELREEVNDG